MELLERYLSAVARELPESLRDEISRELKANLLDSAEQKEQELGRVLNGSEWAELLRQCGHPARVARQFAPARPLVAADDMPLLWHVLAMVIGVIFVFEVVEASARLVFSDPNPFRFVFQLLADVIRQGCFVFAVIVISFWLAAQDGRSLSSRYAQLWEPSQLPKAEQSWRYIRLSDVFTDLATYIFVLVLTTLPVWMSDAQQQGLLLVFNSDAQLWLWFFSPVMALSVAFCFWQLQRRLWSKAMLKTAIAVNLSWFALLIWLGMQYPLWQQPLLEARQQPLDGLLTHLQLERGFSWGLLVSALFPGYEVVRDSLRLRRWD